MKKEAVLLVNLGSPDSTNPKDVKTYLDEFLMDKYVIDYPYALRALLVKGIVLNVRPKKSAAAYSKIWWNEGSPLIILSEQLKALVQERLDVPVALGMRYGNPSIEFAIQNLLKKHPQISNLFVVPLYPQYAESTTRTVIEKTKEVIKKNKWNLQVTFQPPFFKEEIYIKALGESIRPYINQYEHFLFSYHGVPKRHVKKTDPTGSHCQKNGDCCAISNPQAQKNCYRHHCIETTNAVVNYLELPKEKYSVSFQSRLGPEKWIEPYTDKSIEELAHNGIKSLAVVCPAFVSDCLETLEEIGMEGKEEFIEAGGESFTQIPCLNTNKLWVDTLESYCNRFLQTLKETQAK